MTPRKPKIMTDFEVGDLVRVIEGTHDPALPSHRVGLVVEVQIPGNRKVSVDGGNIYMVQFGTSILRFHEMWLDRVES